MTLPNVLAVYTCMATGTRKELERQEGLWVAWSEIVGTPAHAFYDRLNEILDRHHFDRNVEHPCRRYYKGPLGRPRSRARVSTFEPLLLGYFEGIDRERGIAVARGRLPVHAQVHRLRADGQVAGSLQLQFAPLIWPTSIL